VYGDREGVKPVSNYEHVRDVEHFGDVTKFHPFNQGDENDLVDWLQPPNLRLPVRSRSLHADGGLRPAGYWPVSRVTSAIPWPGRRSYSYCVGR